MLTNTQSGKAFEFALISEAYNILSPSHNVNLITNAVYQNSRACFDIFTTVQKAKYMQAASTAIRHIITLEPRLNNPSNARDTLTLQLQPDSAGISGDVRDILFIRSSQNWEVGISAKNNHKALKHSRLSNVLDFGNSWVGVPSSPQYFQAINPVFTRLAELRLAGAYWRDMANKQTEIYRPILDAFRNELIAINVANPNIH